MKMQSLNRSSLNNRSLLSRQLFSLPIWQELDLNMSWTLDLVWTGLFQTKTNILFIWGIYMLTVNAGIDFLFWPTWGDVDIFCCPCAYCGLYVASFWPFLSLYPRGHCCYNRIQVSFRLLEGIWNLKNKTKNKILNVFAVAICVEIFSENSAL